MTILSGKQVADALMDEVASINRQIMQLRGAPASLHVILVGTDPASEVYVGKKEQAAAERGLVGAVHRFPASMSQSDLIKEIEQLNGDATVDALLVQMPLPPQIDFNDVIWSISPEKDADGLHPLNFGKAFASNKESLRSCTPSGVMKILDFYKIPLEGKHAVVVGRSQIVGKPMALMLLERNCTVTICHSKTVGISSHLQSADLIIAAAGIPRFIKKEQVKPGAVVVDVGIHRMQQGSKKLCGDVDESVYEVAGAMTPVPGGVGPLTIAMLLWNTVVSTRDKLIG